MQGADFYDRIPPSDALAVLDEIRGTSARHLLDIPRLEAAVRAWPAFDPRQPSALMSFAIAVWRSLAMGLFLAELAGAQASGQLLHVARDGPRASHLAELVRFFAPGLEVIVLPAWDCLPYDRVSPNQDVMAERLDALARLLDLLGHGRNTTLAGSGSRDVSPPSGHGGDHGAIRTDPGGNTPAPVGVDPRRT